MEEGRATQGSVVLEGNAAPLCIEGGCRDVPKAVTGVCPELTCRSTLCHGFLLHQELTLQHPALAGGSISHDREQSRLDRTRRPYRNAALILQCFGRYLWWYCRAGHWRGP